MFFDTNFLLKSGENGDCLVALRCTIFLVCLLSFPSSSLSLFTVVYQPLWLKITQFPKLEGWFLSRKSKSYPCGMG